MKRLILIAASAALVAACQPPVEDAAPAVEIADLTCRPAPNGRDITVEIVKVETYSGQ